MKVSESELHDLLREAVRQRVAAGLPTDVPDEIRNGLTEEVAQLQDTFSEIDISRDIPVLAPDSFPPCVSSLVERAQDGEDLSDPAEFALVAFLTSANADTDELLALCGVDSDTRAKSVRYGERLKPTLQSVSRRPHRLPGVRWRPLVGRRIRARDEDRSEARTAGGWGGRGAVLCGAVRSDRSRHQCGSRLQCGLLSRCSLDGVGSS